MADTSVPTLLPMFSVRDPNATLDWFAKLGFEAAGVMMMPDGSIGHAEVQRGPNLRFMVGPGQDGCYGSAGLSLYVNIDEPIDAYHARVTAAGIEAGSPPQDQFWGDRTFTVTHPDGYEIWFFEHVRDVSEEEMKRAVAQMAPA